MEPNQQIVLPEQHLLINLAPSIMVMPGTNSFVELDEHMSSKMLLQAVRDGQSPYLFAVMSDPRVKEAPDKFCKVGVIAEAEADMEDSVVILRGLFRAEMLSIKMIEGDDYRLWLATVKKVEDENHDDYFVQAHQHVMADMIIIKKLLIIFLIRARGFYRFDNRLMRMIVDDFENTDWGDKDAVDSFIWATLHSVPDLFQEDKQPFLESTILPERIKLCVKTLKERLQLLEIQKQNMSRDDKSAKRADRIATNVRVLGSNDKDQDELDANTPPEIVERWGKYKKIKDTLNPGAQKAILGDFARLKSCCSGQAEWNTFINHLDCLLELYSTMETPQEEDVSKVEKTLDDSHYGLESVKDEIYNHLAVKNLNPKGKAPILCFVGPPGVGKTSIGKSIAEALGLKFIRLSLGGIRDEADVRGHRLTYIGAIPGKIIQEIIRIGVKNPVFMLDEIDKIGSDFRGDPSSALLEVLDPEQNYSFQDHYVGAQYDLSSVLFLCTANTASGIQPALLDRMNVVNISGYTEFQKIQIAKKFLIPKQFAEVGLTDKGVTPCWPDNNPDQVISKIISGYTREAGVRELERQIHKILSIWARQYLKEDDDKKQSEILITEEMVEKFLGLPKQTHERVSVTEIGEAIGLAWTPVGGDIIYVQAQLTPHGRTEKDISQTGNLGKVFEEANKNAFTVAKNLLRNDKKAMKKLIDDLLCMSAPEGAIPKDGPSAGITMAMAIYSELIGKPLKPYVAMSGEITIKGRVRAVGGIKEKILAAHRDGIREIILPVHNKRDVDKEIPDEIKRDIKFHYVTHAKEVLSIVFPENQIPDSN